MNETNQTILVVLAAVLVGTTLPLLLQLFFAARSLRRVLGSVDRKVDGALGELSEVVATLRGTVAPTSPFAAIGSALLPTLLPTIAAAVEAFREQMAAPAGARSAARAGVRDDDDLAREAA